MPPQIKSRPCAHATGHGPLRKKILEFWGALSPASPQMTPLIPFSTPALAMHYAVARGQHAALASLGRSAVFNVIAT